MVVDNTSGLNIPKGYQIKVLADVPSARDLELTSQGVLLVSSPGPGKIFAIKDDQAKVVIDKQDKPHGLAFYQNQLYVASETNITRYNWDESTLTATLDKKILDLPSGGRHTSRTIVFDQGGRLFVSLGSSCDVCFEKNPWLGSVIVTDKDGKDPQVFASGLRNAVFLTLNQNTNQVWATEMGRDFLGDNLPPDEINILDKGNFGWPICYGARVYDQKFGKETPAFCNGTIPPVFEIPAHSAPLGLKFINSPIFPADWQGDLLVSYHGSWNSSTPVGYKVVRLQIGIGKPISSHDFITGFLQSNQVIGRPVDLEFGLNGELYISDDKAGKIYLLTKSE